MANRCRRNRCTKFLPSLRRSEVNCFSAAEFTFRMEVRLAAPVTALRGFLSRMAARLGPT